jgi:hypothetical protein
MSENLLSDLMIELHVPSFELAKQFYGSLGFEVVWEIPPQEQRGYLVLRRKTTILNFYCGNEHVYEHSYFSRFRPDTVRSYAVEIIIPLDDIETFYAHFQETYPDRIVKPLNHKYSRWDFRMEDPFGFYVRFVERYDWVNGRDKNGRPL